MPERKTINLRIRAANRIWSQIRQRATSGQSVAPLTRLLPRVEQLGELMGRWSICQWRRWDVAADVLSQRAQRLLAEIPQITTDLDRVIRKQHRILPCLRDIIEDLEQLESEFECVRYKPGAVCAAVEPITLDGVYLGPFEIQLPYEALEDLSRDGAYRVIAIDPQRPNTDASVTHPHVQDHKVCEGEASAAIQQALTDGRICDFFVLVRSVLQTYNPASAYVMLEQWDGVYCGECGDTVGRDDCFYCTGCDADRCGDCIVYCTACDDPFCGNCVGSCTLCDSAICCDCTRTCPGCSDSVCAGCIESCCRFEEEEEESNDKQSAELQPLYSG